MGRLRKHQVEQIQRLLKAGNTQVEVAQKLGINIKTVRKYDPTRGERRPRGSPFTWAQLDARISALEAAYYIQWAGRDEWQPERCPYCRFTWERPSGHARRDKQSCELQYDDEEDELWCPQCGRRYALPDAQRIALGVEGRLT